MAAQDHAADVATADVMRRFREQAIVDAAMPTESLNRFARAAARKGGDAAANAISEYQRCADGTARGARRALAALLAWMNASAPRPKAPWTERDAAEVYADAVLALDAFQAHELRQRRPTGTKPRLFHSRTVKPLREVARMADIEERTLRRRCVAGDLPASAAWQEKRPKLAWAIDLTECDRVSPENAYAKLLVERIRSEKASRSASTARPRTQ